METCVLKCSDESCGREYALERRMRLFCDGETAGQHGPALLRAQYSRTEIQMRDLPGIFRFSDWLPANGVYFRLPDRELSVPFSYKSQGLADCLGLANLFIAFSGYWPERGGNTLTRSFKEFEAQASISSFLFAFGNEVPPLIVASAGNTANAYNLFTSLLNLPLYLIVPEIAVPNLLLPIRSAARVLAVKGDYSEAISMAEKLSRLLDAHSDGGVRNIARRAGMATVYLNAVVHPEQGSHALFDHYFQAVGSGAGAIATSEIVETLVRDGRFGKTRTRIHIAQNDPFAPIPDAWNGKSRTVDTYPSEESRLRRAGITASVLVNRTPAYSITGGLYEALARSRGTATRVSNFELFTAANKFREVEGVDVDPAAAVAIAALFKAVAAGEVQPADSVLLHVTGGGRELQMRREKLEPVVPVGIVAPSALDEAIAALRYGEAPPCRRELFQQAAISS
jgi:cysteate synthase